MPTILSPETASTVLDSYSDLLDKFTSYAHSTNLTTMFPTFLLLAEERINRLLRCRDMETAFTETTLDSDYTMAAPSDMLAVKSLYPSGYEDHPLTVVGYDKLLKLPGSTYARYYAWVGDTIYCDGPATLNGIYLAKVTALSATEPTNWLIQKHPLVYLAGCLVEAFVYKRDDPEATRWDQRFLATIKEINVGTHQDVFAGPLTVRAG